MMEEDPVLEKILSSIRTRQKVEVNPFLYTRIQERLRRPQTARIPAILRPAISIPLLAVLVMANVLMIRLVSRESSHSNSPSITEQVAQAYFQDSGF